MDDTKTIELDFLFNEAVSAVAAVLPTTGSAR
jgi:hypothetical protein